MKNPRITYYALRVKVAREELDRAENILFSLAADVVTLPELETAEQEYYRAICTVRSDEQWLASEILWAMEEEAVEQREILLGGEKVSPGIGSKHNYGSRVGERHLHLGHHGL